MSKSLGNVIEAQTLLMENPVDLVRLYFMRKSSPIESLNFSMEEMKTRSYQILSTLHNLHVYFKQNSIFDKFDQKEHTLQWVIDNNLLGPTEIWLLSKLQGLISAVTETFNRCRFHEGAKAIEEFIINHLSQTYIPLTRNLIWDDSADTIHRRLAIYSIIAHVLLQIDIMLHPLSPFITEYLYLTCFNDKKKSILLEKWPNIEQKYVNNKIEVAFDKIKEIVSLANAARNLAGLKRRWPIKEAMICGSNVKSIGIDEEVSEALRSQLNVENYYLKEIAITDSQIGNIIELLNSRMPIAIQADLIRKNVAPRVKADFTKVAQAFEKIDKFSLISLLHTRGKYLIRYDEDKEIELLPSDIEFTYNASEGYTSSKRDDMIVFISTSRDQGLVAKGLLRDLARQLQQLRKERQYNPTDKLAMAYVAGLTDEEIRMLTEMKNELTYLVRVSDLALSKESIFNVNYKAIEIDGREYKVWIE
jgi:isoleucyl-tRNA synthetase